MSEPVAIGADDHVDVLRAVAAAARAKNRDENFPVALRLLPAAARDGLLRIYTYARFVDDVGDLAPGDRSALLDTVAADVRRLPGGARLTPVAALAPLVGAGVLTTEPLLHLIEANQLDQTVTSYPTFDDLLAYCAKSAAPVGRMVLMIAGATGAVSVRRSDAICTALQVLEHCQDVREDAIAGRVYLPGLELEAAGVGVDDLRAGTTSPALRGVIAAQVARADRLLAEGRPLVRELHGWSRVAVSGFLAGGLATAHALRAADYDVLARPVRPRRLRVAATAVRLAVGG